MINSERKSIGRAIRSVIPSLYEVGALLAAVPRGRVLRGVYLESSSDPTRGYVWVFVQPLYVPASTIVFNFGKRLGSPSKTWGATDIDRLLTVVHDEGEPFFGPVSSPEAFGRWELLDGRADLSAREAKSYTLIATGRFAEGAVALRELAGSLPKEPPWMVEVGERARMLAALAETNPTGARDLLAAWEQETVSALGVQGVL